MSQSTATTACPPVTVLCSSTSLLTTAVTMEPTLMGLTVTLGQPDVVLLCYWPNHHAAATTLVPVPPQACTNYAMGHS